MSVNERLEEIRSSKDPWYHFDYADLLAATDLEVVSEDYFGSYQGDIVFHVRDEDGRNGLLIQGYGSCSGCDALEAAQPWEERGDLTNVAALAEQIRADVIWAGAEGLLAALDKRLAAGSDWWTYSEDNPIPKAREIATAVDSAVAH